VDRQELMFADHELIDAIDFIPADHTITDRVDAEEMEDDKENE
jgi:hypothetical protein